jgi:ATP-binding cassette subfamily B protein
VLANRTTLLIAHRLSTLHLADRIVVLDQGRIVDQGSHDDFAARSALYRTLISGLQDGAEQIGDQIETLAMLPVGLDPRTNSARTNSARTNSARTNSARTNSARTDSARTG